MPISGYGVCKARPISRRLATGGSPHYQIELVDEAGVHYRVAVNVKSQLAPSDLMFHVDPNFVHPITAIVEAKPSGFTPLASQAESGALDFIRGNLFQPTTMIKIPALADGPDNDLNEKLDQVVQRAMADEEALVYAFGQRWGPENKADQYFGFIPGNGIHDIHMNQGNAGSFVKDDGVWQDGGLLFQFPKQTQWVAIFLKFQSQAWHTDDTTGHTLGDPGNPDPTGTPTET
ncbi:MAG: YukJ family protein, partial [Bryobacteraceae bacterium]